MVVCHRNRTRAVVGLLLIVLGVAAGCKRAGEPYVLVQIIDAEDRGVFVKNLADERIRYEPMPDGSLKVYIESAEQLRARTSAYREWQAVRINATELAGAR